MRRNYGGRGTARYPENADVHGKLRERRFDLPAEAPPVRLSESELAAEAYAAMGATEADRLQGWIVSTLTPATARTGDGRGKMQNALWTDDLCADASAFMGQPVQIRQLNGALQAAGYKPVGRTSRGAVWAIGAMYKDS